MLDQKVADALVLHDAAAACEDPADEVYVEVVGTGYHLRRTRRRAEFMIEVYPDRYRMADGPDKIDEEKQPWEIYDDDGEIIDTNRALDAVDLTDEDRARILEYRSDTTEDERRAHRATLFARARLIDS